MISALIAQIDINTVTVSFKECTIILVERYVAIAVNPEKIGAVKTHTS